MEKYYGQFGGQFVSESLMNTLSELEKHTMKLLQTKISGRITTTI